MEVKRTDAKKYTMRKDGQWLASVFIDDDVGEISIHSDWGDFWFGWYPSGRGTKTLREFLIGCDASYLCNKFMHSYRQAGVGVKAHDHVEKRLLILLAQGWSHLRDQWTTELREETHQDAVDPETGTITIKTPESGVKE